jgi:pimeloyl-ACP methyl ester carboxylesterase
MCGLYPSEGQSHPLSRGLRPARLARWAPKTQYVSLPFKITGQIITTDGDCRSEYTHPIPLHFVHHQSPRQGAIPLLYIHSSPGSFIEVENIIDVLTNPPNNTLPAFHVAAPDIPGFSFSPAPEHPGLGLREAGQSFKNLMSQLGYDKYVIRGGDVGALTLRHMATDFPDSVVSVLSNFYLVFPNATDVVRWRCKGYPATQLSTPIPTSVIFKASTAICPWFFSLPNLHAPALLPSTDKPYGSSPSTTPVPPR